MAEKVVSVSKLTNSLKSLLEVNFSNIRVEGEISNFKEHSSGHRYFTLKDNAAQISCTMWKSRPLRFLPNDGMKVVLTGNVTIYPPRGNYQIDVSSIEPAGQGDLYMAYEALKQKLEGLGYFAAQNKKMLPKLPMHIGIATSATGAALQDMLSTISRRFAGASVYFRPTLVQGEGSAEDVVRAIGELELTPAEVIIIGRGGGSIEDLWAFNMEIVADAIFNARVPIISAVGHETDFTIADFVADFRAATPTAAAELVTPYLLRELDENLSESMFYLDKLMKSAISRKKEELGSTFGKRVNKLIGDTIKQHSQTLDVAEMIARKKLEQTLAMKHVNLEHQIKLLHSFHPLDPLRRGFALLKSEGVIIKAGTKLEGLKEMEVIRENDSALVKIEKVYQGAGYQAAAGR